MRLQPGTDVGASAIRVWSKRDVRVWWAERPENGLTTVVRLGSLGFWLANFGHKR